MDLFYFQYDKKLDAAIDDVMADSKQAATVVLDYMDEERKRRQNLIESRDQLYESAKQITDDESKEFYKRGETLFTSEDYSEEDTERYGGTLRVLEQRLVLDTYYMVCTAMAELNKKITSTEKIRGSYAVVLYSYDKSSEDKVDEINKKLAEIYEGYTFKYNEEHKCYLFCYGENECFHVYKKACSACEYLKKNGILTYRVRRGDLPNPKVQKITRASVSDLAKIQLARRIIYSAVIIVILAVVWVLAPVGERFYITIIIAVSLFNLVYSFILKFKNKKLNKKYNEFISTSLNKMTDAYGGQVEDEAFDIDEEYKKYNERLVSQLAYVTITALEWPGKFFIPEEVTYKLLPYIVEALKNDMHYKDALEYAREKIKQN